MASNGNVSDGMGRTRPCTERVVLGYVTWVGSLDTDASGVAREGREIKNGKDGADNDRVVGVRMLAVAAKFRFFGSEETMNDFNVIRSETGGKGGYLGRPGMAGILTWMAVRMLDSFP